MAYRGKIISHYFGAQNSVQGLTCEVPGWVSDSVMKGGSTWPPCWQSVGLSALGCLPLLPWAQSPTVCSARRAAADQGLHGVPQKWGSGEPRCGAARLLVASSVQNRPIYTTKAGQGSMQVPPIQKFSGAQLPGMSSLPDGSVMLWSFFMYSLSGLT